MLFWGKQTLLILSVGFFLATKATLGSEKIAYDLAHTAEELMTSSEKQNGSPLTYSFADPSRENWHFFPNWSGRTGVPLYQLSKEQRLLVKKMVELLLSEGGYLEYKNLRLIHGIRKDLNAPDNPMHRYSISIFGKPSINSTWGWRLEGHHLSLNCTLVDGQAFSVTPSFLGASPVRVSNGKYAGMELFKQEQSLSLELVNSFSDSQKRKAELGSGNGPEAVSRVSREEYENLPGIPFLNLLKVSKIGLSKSFFYSRKNIGPKLLNKLMIVRKFLIPPPCDFPMFFPPVVMSLIFAS